MFKKITLIVVSGFTALSMMAFAPLAADAVVTAQTDTGLSAEETAGLLKMREEEKLAHDVYIYLYEKWGLNSFENIARSEQTHMDEVKVLLDAYSLSDPSSGNPAGVFTDPELQKLYNDLTKQGSESLAAALKVGGAIEEIDILDLRELVKNVTHSDIQVVYQNLENGSENHLRAFSGSLERQTGETYKPQYMSADDYQAIASDSNGNSGNGHGLGTGAGNGNGNATGNGTGNGVGVGSGSGYRGGRN
ncbi:hypothetical protein hrd7_02480 [Leptolinea sp. HRD-7]|nr:hypothetical protein hrd7_02480 [Leptolinea sp. HRD-7]